MKPNPERNWSIQFWGDGAYQYHSVTLFGTLESALAHADAEECEFEWNAIRISIVALSRP